MNVVCLFGNGFDLAAGLKTSYGEFRRWYLNEHKITALNREFELALKDEIYNGVISHPLMWSDMELALGSQVDYIKLSKYTHNQTLSTVEEVRNFIETALKEYLRNQDSKFNPVENACSIFISGLKGVLSANNCLPIEDIHYSYISLNYTRTLEKILGDCHTAVIHPHNTIYDGNIIFGIDNSRQMSRGQVGGLSGGEQLLIKETWKKIPEVAIAELNRADVIITYGLSFGCTDDRWWTILAEICEVGKTRLLVCPYSTCARYISANMLPAQRRHEGLKPLIDAFGRIRHELNSSVVTVAEYTDKNDFGDFFNLKAIGQNL